MVSVYVWIWIRFLFFCRKENAVFSDFFLFLPTDFNIFISATTCSACFINIKITYFCRVYEIGSCIYKELFDGFENSRFCWTWPRIPLLSLFGLFIFEIYKKRNETKMTLLVRYFSLSVYFFWLKPSCFVFSSFFIFYIDDA